MVALLSWMLAATAYAQVAGNVSVTLDVLPDPDPAPGRQGVVENRVRVVAERRDQFGEHVRVVLSGHVDGLVGRWRSGEAVRQGAIARPLDAYVELAWKAFEIRAGASRVVWGRLDEFQPTDVVNPIDLSKFLLEGRSEARLSVGVVRGRWFLPGSTTLDVIAVPGFRRGRFDQLHEDSSPFNLGVSGPALVGRQTPAFGGESLQGGARVTSTAKRVDFGATVYRGRRAFPVVTATVSPFSAPDDGGLPVVGPLLTETFPRFTMVGGDFETAAGLWGVRGEVAYFLSDGLQLTSPVRGVPGSSVEGGIGVDRRAGDYRVAANLLVSRRAVDAFTPIPDGGSRSDTDVTVVIAADRSFSRETRTLRLFAVNDPGGRTLFVRAIGAVSLRDNLWLEGSGGIFAGASTSTIGRLTDRDFAYVRLKAYF